VCDSNPSRQVNLNWEPVHSDKISWFPCKTTVYTHIGFTVPLPIPPMNGVVCIEHSDTQADTSPETLPSEAALPPCVVTAVLPF